MAEWGYNRDHEDLPQVNVCLYFGEGSGLPVYLSLFPGSVHDVSTLKQVTGEFAAISDNAPVMNVTDKGFYSASNVRDILDNTEIRFLMPVSFTANFAKRQIESESKDVDSFENVILTNGEPIRGVCKVRKWEKRDLYTHVFFNPEKALRDRNDLYAHVKTLENLAKANPDNAKYASEFGKYLIIRRSSDSRRESGYTVNVRTDVLDECLKRVGWFVCISSHLDDPQKAYDVYRMKDVVEKGFWKCKNALGMDRFRVHSDQRMTNKVFVTFIALVLL
jgi:transposase